MSSEKARKLAEDLRRIVSDSPEYEMPFEDDELQTILEALERMAGLRISDEMASSFRAWRGIEETCRDCGGSGRKAYPSTAVWLGGIGGCAITDDVCDRCWGTGDEQRKGANLLNMIRESEALQRKLDAALADSEQLRKDAERWRKLSKMIPANGQIGIWSDCEGVCRERVVFINAKIPGEGGTLDEAIDTLEVPE